MNEKTSELKKFFDTEQVFTCFTRYVEQAKITSLKIIGDKKIIIDFSTNPNVSLNSIIAFASALNNLQQAKTYEFEIDNNSVTFTVGPKKQIPFGFKFDCMSPSPSCKQFPGQSEKDLEAEHARLAELREHYHPVNRTNRK
jgi:hypothetical protein